MLLQMITEAVDECNWVSLTMRQDLLWVREVPECGVCGPRDGVCVGRILGGHDKMPWSRFYWTEAPGWRPGRWRRVARVRL
jgi:hypothetical protein